MTHFAICATTSHFSRYRFTGKERDTESGNDYFGARYYASAMGRWLSPDWSAKVAPIPYVKLDDPQTLNLYAYMQNSPLSGVDPDGHVAPSMCGTGGQGCKHLTARDIDTLGNGVGIALGVGAVGVGAGAVGPYVPGLIGLGLANAPRIQNVAVSLAEGVTPGASPGSMGSVWSMAPAARGLAIESQLGANLPQNFPTIDKFANGIATSIKSLDLNASSYQNAGTLASTVTGYIDKVAGFSGGSLSGTTITSGQITGRALELAVPGAGTAAQRGALNSAMQYAKKVGVQLTIKQVQ